jgi:hypothetical protein
MKLTVEIKESRFEYSYQIGDTDRHTSSCKLDTDGLCAFTTLLGFLSKVSNSQHDRFMDQIHGKAWIEQHPEEAMEFAKQHLAHETADRGGK